MRNVRLPPPCKWDLRSFVILSSAHPQNRAEQISHGCITSTSVAYLIRRCKYAATLRHLNSHRGHAPTNRWPGALWTGLCEYFRICERVVQELLHTGVESEVRGSTGMLLQLQVFMGVRPCSTGYSWKVMCNLQLTLVVVYAAENEPSFTYDQ